MIKNTKDTNWKIKIWDLLAKTWSADTVQIKEKFLENENKIISPWISCDIYINSINKEDIWIKINNINCQLSINCDICGSEYIYNINSPEYSCIYTTDHKKVNTDNEQEYYPIDNDNIDISDIIRFAINLELESINRCEKCEEDYKNHNYQDDEESDEEINNENEYHLGNIIFK